jgi:hypothetical protein
MKSLTLVICSLTMAFSCTKGQDVSSTSSGKSVGESDRKFLLDLEQANKPKAPPFRIAHTANTTPVNVSSAAKAAEPSPKVSGPASSESLLREITSNGTQPTIKQPKQELRDASVGRQHPNRENSAASPEIATNDSMFRINLQPITVTKTTVTTTPVNGVDNKGHGFLYRIFHRNNAALRPGE